MAIILPYRGVTPRIDPSAFIAETAVIIGDVEIGANTGIWYGCVLRGDVHEIKVGSGTNIQDGTVVHCAKEKFGCYIGDNVTIGHMALIHACTVQSNSFIGMKACVLDGATVQSHAMVAAGALVTPGKTVPSGQLWAGSPAKFMKELGPKDAAAFDDIAPRYAELAREYREALHPS